ncbi:MAG: hypothetical protein SGJ27_25565 [Candidatus Melainabacteria bacterium]|nr:hypothetical protein [Candidatus Melainabacteria bacterium]
MIGLCQRYPRIALAFVLVPILFNMVMWQNYPVSALPLLPQILLNAGISFALLAFGLGFGILTSMFSLICFLSFLKLGFILKKSKIAEFVMRHLALFAGFWIVTFTVGSFAGFLLIVCVKFDIAHSNLFLSGLQGFLIMGLGAGSAGMFFAIVWASIFDLAKRLVVRG